MGFPDHVSGYTIILSSSAKFLCLHTQEQQQYFFPVCCSPHFVVTDFSQISCFKPTAPSKDLTAPAYVTKANALSSFRSNSNPYCSATSLYIVKAYKALPSLNCHLWPLLLFEFHFSKEGEEDFTLQCITTMTPSKH